MKEKITSGTAPGIFTTVALSVAAIIYSTAAQAENEAGVLPPNARPGECYAKVMIPAEYKTEKENVIIREASQKIEVIPAKYTTTEVQVPIQEASKKLVVVPATFVTDKEKIEIEPAHTLWRTGLTAKASAASAHTVAIASALGLADDAKPGQCFVEYFKAEEYKTEAQKLVSKDASEVISVAEPAFEWKEERVLIKEASFNFVEVPAQFEEIQEKILESPAYTTWKTGAGPNQRVDHATGEIMCLVEVPAKYRTVTKRVLKTAATTKKVEIPAQYEMVRVHKLVTPAKESRASVQAEYQSIEKRFKVSDAKISWLLEGKAGAGKATGNKLCLTEVPAKYKTITKQVVKTPATVKTVEIPASFKSMKMTKLVSPAENKKIEIPAKFQTIDKTTKVRDTYQAWQPVLCETNTTKKLVLQIQQALHKAGYNPGKIDGVLGRDTMTAVSVYQSKNDLARGGLTLETIKKLGIQGS